MFRITELCSILDTSVKFWTLLSESFFYYYYARLFVCSAKPFRRLRQQMVKGDWQQLERAARRLQLFLIELLSFISE